MRTTPDITGVSMGDTHTQDDWHAWRHGVDARLDSLEQRLDKVEERLTMVEHRLIAIQRDLRWGGGMVLLLLAAQIGANAVR